MCSVEMYSSVSSPAIANARSSIADDGADKRTSVATPGVA
jgi:hypothetical protein